MSAFIAGFRSFIEAFLLVLRNPSIREWYFGQVKRALGVGLLILIGFSLGLGFFFWWLFQFMGYLIPADWVTGIAGVGLVLVWLVVVFFTAGPISILLLNLLLTQWVNWPKLRDRLSGKLKVAEFDEAGLTPKAILVTVSRAVILSFLILVSAVLAFIPLFAILPAIMASFALGSDALWTVDDLYGGPAPAKKKAPSYAIGLAIIPGLLSSIPVIGVASIPILQLASLLRYTNLGDLNRR